MHNHPYRRLFVMAGASFVAMFVLMYSMVNSAANVYVNVNQVYMAGLMAAPMIVIELLVMRSMYANRRLVRCVGAASGIFAIQARTRAGDVRYVDLLRHTTSQ